MPNVSINELYNLGGEYPLDLVFTHRDFRDIKRIAGVRANEVMESLNAGDMDVLVAIAAIALRRSGKQFDVEQLWDAEAGWITLDLTDQEADGTPSSDKLRRQRAREQRQQLAFWDSYVRTYGALPSEREPESFWYAGAGEFGVAPSEIANLTPQQFHGIYQVIQARNKDARKRSR